MSLSIMQFDRVPSIGALLGTQGPREVLDLVNSKLGGSSFFGSSADPFAEQQKFFIEKVVAPIRMIGQQFKTQFSEMLNKHTNSIRPITSLHDLEYGIPECMWLPIAMHPTIKKFGEQKRIDMFGIDSKSLPNENPYLRLINNGVDIDLAEYKKLGEDYMYTVEIRTDDPEVTDEELDAIADTYDFIDLFYNGLDQLYDKIGKSDILKKKSYMTDDLELRDLDITSFPDKKG